MATVQHPSGTITWRVEDPGPYVSVGWADVTWDASLDSMTVAQLRAGAKERGIDLGEATKKADIIAVIRGV